MFKRGESVCIERRAMTRKGCFERSEVSGQVVFYLFKGSWRSTVKQTDALPTTKKHPLNAWGCTCVGGETYEKCTPGSKKGVKQRKMRGVKVATYLSGIAAGQGLRDLVVSPLHCNTIYWPDGLLLCRRNPSP